MMESLFTQECIEAADRWSNDESLPRGKRPTSIRVMRNWFFENFFGKAHPLSPALWFGPFLVFGAYRAATGPTHPLASAALFFAGVLLISLVEYCLHRFLFHWKPKTGPFRFYSFLWHGYHHEFPNDPMRLVAPPFMSWPVAVVMYVVATSVAGVAWPQFFAGMVVGYLAYDWTHYYTHHFRPKNPIGRFLRDYHLQHHFDKREGRYGVSTPLWDLVFGTYLPLKRADASSVAEASS